VQAPDHGPATPQRLYIEATADRRPDRAIAGRSGQHRFRRHERMRQTAYWNPGVEPALGVDLGVTRVGDRKEFRSIVDLASDIAYRKRRAAQARVAGTPPGLESPRDIYLAACASIAAYLEESYGFKYSKSGPHAKQRSGDFTFEISFHSSHNNVAGEHVCLTVYGSVLSARIKRWRESQPLLAKWDSVAGGQIGNLQTDHCWLEWELADAGKRDEVIRDAISAIEELAIPYFAKFEDLPSLFRLLVNEDVPAMEIGSVVEFLMCFADQPTARRAAASFLERREDLVPTYQRDFKRFAERGLDSGVPIGGLAMELAFMSHAFEFGDLTAEGA
jgi:hypothetical protein